MDTRSRESHQAEEDRPDLDHDQDDTDNLQKSEKPDKGYMDEKGLCPVHHGPLPCKREGCPHK